MKFLLYTLFLFKVSTLFSQENKIVSPIVEIDSLYREDQFFLGFTYNSMLNRATGISQNKFSSGFTLGYLRDMPINKKRNVAIAFGLGLTYNKSFQNLQIVKTNQVVTYAPIAAGTNYKKNKLDQVYLDMPLEFRWRTSTAESHKFWRIYYGLKFSYLILDKYAYADNELNYKILRNKDLNTFQVGTFLTLGYNTWNFYAYYGLTPFFNSDAKINNEDVGLNALNLGIMFYVL